MYKTEDKVLLRDAWKPKINPNTYLCPLVITAVRDKETVGDSKDRNTDTFNISNLNQYKE